MRGLAILLVIFHNESGIYPSLHLGGVFANGWMGVDLFFVLSGFLITGILLETKQSPVYFRNFYARRTLRIWPLYFVSIFFMFVMVPFLRPAEAGVIFERSSPWWAYPLYLQNILVQVPAGAVGLLGVTWSLAIEEQFYLVWAVVMRVFSRSVLSRIAVGVICGSPVLRVILASHGVNLYSNTFSRLDGLMAGALLAILVRSVDFVPARFLRTAWIVLFITVPLAFLTVAMNAQWIVFSMSALASVSLVYIALYSKQEWIHRVLKNRFMVYTGTISYGLYLLHKIPFDFALSFHLNAHPISAPLLLAVCYGMAALSWNFYEKPFLSLKRFFEPESASPRREGELVVEG
jgi:peptidoglycan/LPS O-acetylase OafA/YrhL